MISQPGASVADWQCSDTKEGKICAYCVLQFEQRALNFEAEELSYRFDNVDFDHSWENVSRLLVPLAIKLKTIRMLRGSSFTGILAGNCDDNIQAYTRCNSPYVKFYYFGKMVKKVKVTI